MNICVVSRRTFHTNTTCSLQKWQAELGSEGYVGTILMDLSKAYGFLSHDLLIAKLEAYGSDIGSLLDYLSLRKHRTKLGSSSSKWPEIS